MDNSINVENFIKTWNKVQLKSNLLDIVKNDVKDVLDVWMAGQNKQKFRILDQIKFKECTIKVTLKKWITFELFKS